MNEASIVLQGTVTPDGALTVDQKISMPAGRVKITIQPATESKPLQKDWWQQMQEARAFLEARGTGFRSQEEIETEREALWA
jgi:hypothetical protein